MAGSGPWIARSRAELFAGVQSRVVVDPSDARSGSVFERVTINGQRYFAKTLGYRTDWIMRVTRRVKRSSTPPTRRTRARKWRL